MAAVGRHGPAKVLIHDAARPFVSADLIDSVIGWLDRFPAVVPGMPVAETLKFAPGGMVSRTVDRASIWTAQTPQGFTYDGIRAAYRQGRGRAHPGPYRRCIGCRACRYCHIHDSGPA